MRAIPHKAVKTAIFEQGIGPAIVRVFCCLRAPGFVDYQDISVPSQSLVWELSSKGDTANRTAAGYIGKFSNNFFTRFLSLFSWLKKRIIETIL